LGLKLVIPDLEFLQSVDRGDHEKKQGSTNAWQGSQTRFSVEFELDWGLKPVDFLK
jgi:hypothetical protein